MSAPHRFAITVYYEDTDMGGIVYHANYLKYIERARSNWVRALGIDQMALRGAGVIFAVRAITAEFHAPARLDETLSVLTSAHRVTGARAVLRQQVLRADRVLFEAEVTLACLDMTSGAPRRLPRALADLRMQ